MHAPNRQGRKTTKAAEGFSYSGVSYFFTNRTQQKGVCFFGCPFNTYLGVLHGRVLVLDLSQRTKGGLDLLLSLPVERRFRPWWWFGLAARELRC